MNKEKIPVLQTLMTSFKYVFSRSILSSKFIWKWIILLIIYKFILGFFYGFFKEFLNSNFTLSKLLTYTGIISTETFLNAIFFAPIAIIVHQQIISNKKFTNKIKFDFFSSKNIHFAVVGTLFILPNTIIQSVFVLSMQGITIGQTSMTNLYLNSMVSYYILILLYPFLLVRMIIYLPLFAVDRKKNIFECIRFTKGNTWRLWFMNVLLGIIVVISVRVYPLFYNVFEKNSLLSLMAADILVNIISFFFFLLAVATLSNITKFFIKTN